MKKNEVRIYTIGHADKKSFTKMKVIKILAVTTNIAGAAVGVIRTSASAYLTSISFLFSLTVDVYEDFGKRKVLQDLKDNLKTQARSRIRSLITRFLNSAESKNEVQEVNLSLVPKKIDIIENKSGS